MMSRLLTLVLVVPVVNGTTTTWGFVYGALGRTYIEGALLSAKELKTPNVTVFTAANDTALCEEEKLPEWTCVDVGLAPRIPELNPKTWDKAMTSIECLGRDCDPYMKRFASRVLKIFSMLLSPYDVTFYLDSDTLPCVPAHVLINLLQDPKTNRSLTQVFDLLGAMNHRGSLAIELTKNKDPPGGFYLINGGMFIMTNRPPVRSLLADWLYRIDKRMFHSKDKVANDNTLDQPPFRDALFDALAKRTLTFYPLPPMWNFRSWNPEIGTSAVKDITLPLPKTHFCCEQQKSTKSKHILIDHSCKYTDALRLLPRTGRDILHHKATERRHAAEEEDKRVWLGEQSDVPWRPELDSKNTSWAAVLEELDRSLAEYPSEEVTFEDFLACDENFVLKIKHRIFVSSKFHQIGASKPRAHLMMLLSMIDDLPNENAIYAVDLGARGPGSKTRRRCGPKVPLCVIAKKMGYRSMRGILLPNPYYFPEYFSNLTKWHLTRPTPTMEWPQRIPKAVWRGAVGCADDCDSDYGNWRRFQAAIASWKHPDLLDCKFVGDGNSVRQSPDCVDRGLRLREDGIEAVKLNPLDFVAPFMNIQNFSDYQFALSLPGVMGGSYSRHLNQLWDLDLVVLIYDAHFVEWYFPALHHGITHMAVDSTTLADTVQKVRSNPYGAYRLRSNARTVFDTFISKEGLIRYFRTVLDRLRQKYSRVTSVLDHSLNEDLATYCSKNTLLEFKVSHDDGRAAYELHTISSDDPDLPACASPIDYFPDFLDKATPARFDYFIHNTRIHRRKQQQQQQHRRRRRLERRGETTTIEQCLKIS